MTIDGKLEIVSLLDKNHLLAVIASKYGIGKNTVSNIKSAKSCKTNTRYGNVLDMGMCRNSGHYTVAVVYIIPYTAGIVLMYIHVYIVNGMFFKIKSTYGSDNQRSTIY